MKKQGESYSYLTGKYQPVPHEHTGTQAVLAAKCPPAPRKTRDRCTIESFMKQQVSESAETDSTTPTTSSNSSEDDGRGGQEDDDVQRNKSFAQGSSLPASLSKKTVLTELLKVTAARREEKLLVSQIDSTKIIMDELKQRIAYDRAEIGIADRPRTAFPTISTETLMTELRKRVAATRGPPIW